MNRRAFFAAAATLAMALPTSADDNPIKVLIITGDHGHAWKQTSPFLKEILGKAGMKVDVSEAPARDLTPNNLAMYDVHLLNYKDTNGGGPETRWSEENKKAFAHAIRAEGKGLVVYHHASSAFTSGSDFDNEFEQIIAGGWRKQGNHGKRHEFSVTIPEPDHPITKVPLREYRGCAADQHVPIWIDTKHGAGTGRMSMKVDQPWKANRIGKIEDSMGVASHVGADGDDTIAADGDNSGRIKPSGRTDDAACANQ